MYYHQFSFVTVKIVTYKYVNRLQMFFNKYIFNLNSYLIVLLGLIAVVGDYVGNHSRIKVFQALFDNATHFLVGGLSWFIVCVNYKIYNSYHVLLEVAVCSLVASMIDLDHFVAAKSMHLKDATNLKQRPPLHCSTIPLITCVLLLVLSYILQSSTLKRSTLIFLTAFASHHTRDAARRGYWFYPFGSTPPIPYGVYLFGTCVLPYFICFLYERIKIGNINERLSVI